ncbi:PREDICTED: extracellular glycoprotein lacritin [Cercocebus atys]|uniref:Lacritin n=2 Tax=Cercopithecinae TaxID=9528 RepID=A0A2K5LDX9_CERAT|nr:PREDICTED: extracellular glycoprotein lacritin [Cercocebus atys]XP_025258160.1 extracellular glycoprotein lacritin isoform X1 [Theropithecus gelada]
MKFTTLLFLAAVAGALVYAEDASSDSTDADPAQEAGTSKPNEEISDPAASASPPETTTTAQETSAAVQGTAKVTSSRQELNPLKSIVEKSILLTEQAFARAGKGMPGGLAGGKQFIENGNEFAQKLLKKFGLPKPWA